MIITTPYRFISWALWPMLKHCRPDNLARGHLSLLHRDVSPRRYKKRAHGDIFREPAQGRIFEWALLRGLLVVYISILNFVYGVCCLIDEEFLCSIFINYDRCTCIYYSNIFLTCDIAGHVVIIKGRKMWRHTLAFQLRFLWISNRTLDSCVRMPSSVNWCQSKSVTTHGSAIHGAITKASIYMIEFTSKVCKTLCNHWSLGRVTPVSLESASAKS